MDLENEMWNKLKADIKTELKEDIKAEILAEWRDEIVQSTMKKVDDMIFLERHFDSMLRTYITSLCYEDVHYLRMLNRGLVKQGSNVIPVAQKSTGEIWMTLKNNVNLNSIYDEYRVSGLITCNLENFIDVINFNSGAENTLWYGKGKKGYSFLGLFELYNRIYDYDFCNLNPLIKKRFLKYISVKFLFKGETKEFEKIERSFNNKYGKTWNPKK